MSVLSLLTICLQIDFNAVGVATNLKGSAARMRYSRLKKNIETKLRAASKEVPGTSAKAPAVSTISLATKKIIPGRRPSKKRKIMHETEGEESVVLTHDENIGSATIKDEEFQEWRAGPKTREKKIDLGDSFDRDSDSSGLSELGIRDGEDDYDMEDVSEDEEEFSADEVEGHEADQPVSRRRKSSSQSAKRNMSTAKSTNKLFEKSSEANPRSVPRNYAINNRSKPGVPVPLSVPTGAIKQEPADSIWTIFKTRPDTPQLFPTAKPKIRRHASPPPGLFDHIENARIQADYNLASLSYPTNKRFRSAHDGQTINSETILPSIEHDEEEEEVDEGPTMMKTSCKSSSMPATPPPLRSKTHFTNCKS
jgi:hypothetical protein